MSDPPYQISPIKVSPSENLIYYNFSINLPGDLAVRAFKTTLSNGDYKYMQEQAFNIIAEFGLENPCLRKRSPLVFVRNSRYHRTCLIDFCSLSRSDQASIYAVQKEIQELKDGLAPSKLRYLSNRTVSENQANALIEIWKSWADRLAIIV